MDAGYGVNSPLLYLSRAFVIFSRRAGHHARDVAFHALLVEAVQLEAVGGRGTRGSGAGDLFDCVEGVDEDAVWKVGISFEVCGMERVMGEGA